MTSNESSLSNGWIDIPTELEYRGPPPRKEGNWEGVKLASQLIEAERFDQCDGRLQMIPEELL